jgi:chorismate dehydratase
VVWRVGVVPYLNADPLAAALSESPQTLPCGERAEVRALVPSRLLPALLNGELDTALVSTAGVLPYPSLRILPEMCVASRGPVRSIQLYCRRPLEQVRTVALDASSRSAVALTQVLFAERWRTAPEFSTQPPDLASMLEQSDAALLIGNPALQANEMLDTGRWAGPAVLRFDLGAEWHDLTGLPFVYAVWAVPAVYSDNGRTPDGERLSRLLLHAKRWGMQRLRPLAERGAKELGLPEGVTLDYLTRAIHYDLGAEERAGMERFCELALRHGILPPSSAVRFADLGVGVV